MGEVCSLERHLRVLDAAIVDLQCDSALVNRGSQRDTVHTQHTLRAIFAAWGLRNKHGLNEYIRDKILPMLPVQVQTQVRESMCNGTLRIPHWSTRLQLCLDVSVMRWRRQALSKQVEANYVLADSSPQGDRDWLVSVSRRIDADKLVAVSSAVGLLVADARRLALQADGGGSDDEPELLAPPLDRAALFRVLVDAIQSRTCVPAALGLNKANLEDKVSALFYSIWLETGSERIQTFLDSVVSVTTDLGVESGISEFNALSVQSLLPEWVTRAAIEPDGEQGCRSGVNLAYAAGGAVGFVFINALPVSGILHILSNASKDVYKAMLGWDMFIDSLKTLEGFICKPMRVQRFIALCLEPSPLASFSKRFRNKFPHLYDKRWSEVYKFCCRLSDALPILQEVWDEGLFKHGAGIGGDVEVRDGWQPQTVTCVLQDVYFHAYLDMVLLLDEVMQGMTAWAEQCPCHRHVQEQYRTHVPVAAARAEFGEAGTSLVSGLACPMRGCNAPDLAAGTLFDQLDSSFKQSLSQLSLKRRSQLTAQQWSNLVLDMERGKNHMLYVLTLKLQHWQEAPWSLCILGHADESIARSGARSLLEKFDACPQPQLHHRLTLKFCCAGSPLRGQLEQFTDGTLLADLADLHREACKLRCIPVAERSVERPHGQVMKAITHKHHGPVSVAAALRFRETEKQFSGGSCFDELVACMQEARHVRRIPGLLGISHHPWLRGLPMDAQTSNWVSVLSMIIYRCDDPSQFASFQDARRVNAQAKRKRALAEQAANPKRQAPHRLTLSALHSRLATEHFRAMVLPTQVCSLPDLSPVGVAPSITPLRHYLAAPKPHRRPPCVGIAGFELDTEEDAHVQEAVKPTKRVFFRVVHKNPSQQKVPERTCGSGTRLTHDQLAVSIISSVEASDGEQIEVNTGSLDHLKSTVMSLGSDVRWLMTALTVHDEMSRLTYMLEGLPPTCNVDRACLSETLQGMLAVGAFPPSDVPYTAPLAEEVLLQTLQVHRLVTHMPEAAGGSGPHGWLLTEQGLKLLRLSSALSVGARILEPRTHLPLEDLSVYEQYTMLLDRGWQWHPFPASRVARDRLPPIDLNPEGAESRKVFYTGWTMPIEYLTCLLSLDRLRELGIKAVPHGQRDMVYKKLLQGEPHQHCERNPMLLDVNRDAGKRVRGVIAQGGSGELFSADDAASLAGHDGDPGVDGSDAALATDDEGSLVGALEQLMVEHGVQLPGASGAAGSDPQASPAPGLRGLSPQRVEGVQPLVVAQDPEPAPRARLPRAVSSRSTHGEPWGCFWFVLKFTATSRGAQATCPFHRGTSTAPQCKKFFGLHRGEEDLGLCILRLKAWCLAYSLYDRKRTHLAHVPRVEDLDHDALEQQLARVTGPAPGSVVPDQVLDLQQGVQPPSARRGGGRRQPATTSIGRAGSSARVASSAAAQVAEPCHTGSSSSSSSSSSESDSEESGS